MRGKVEEPTYTLGQIMRMFDLETGGDAWDLVFDKDWHHVQDANGKWQVTVPAVDLPARTRV